MTDNFEDLEHQETVPHEEGAPASTNARSNLAEAWRTRPIFKLLVVMVVAGAAIAAGTTFFGGNKQQQQMSKLVNPPDVHQAPGGAASPYFIQQTKEAEAQRSKEALEKGTSALPTPIGQPGDINVTEKTDPMNELRGETERLKQQLAQMQQVQQQQQAQKAAQAQAQAAAPVAHQPEQFDTNLSQVMQNQMKQLMDSWVPKGIKQVEVVKNGTGPNGEGAGAANGAGGSNPASPIQPVANTIQEKPLVAAGTISYAQLLTEANSDVPAPVLAQIVSGPLNGARAVGAFQVANGYNDYLVLTFTLADLKGKDYKIQAIALDPDTTLAGMATEVDQRYFTRLILPAAAAFLQGFGQAMATTSSNVSTNGDTTIVSQSGPGLTQGIANGASSAANTAAQFFQDQANLTKPLIRIAAGTPMGLFFVSSVFPDGGNGNGSSTNANGGCPSGTTPGYSVGGKIVPTPPGAQPNGCYPTSGGLGAGYPMAGLSPFAGAGLGGAGNAQSSDVPYPNYAGGGANRGFGTGTGFGNVSPLGGAGGYGGYGGLGH